MKRCERSWALIGACAFLPHLIAVMRATSMRPAFNHHLQYLSELGERGSATQSIMNDWGIIPTGIMIAIFGAGLAWTFRRQRLALIAALLILVHGLCRIGAGLFPCDPGCLPAYPSPDQKLHNLAATAGFIMLTAAPFFIGAFLIRQRRAYGFIAFSYTVGVAASIALVMLAMHHDGHAGLYQRIALGVLQLWITGLALFVGRFVPLADVQAPAARTPA